MNLIEKLDSALRQVRPEAEIKVYSTGARRVMATVTSPVFAPLDDTARQEMVWQAILENLTDDEAVQVEFVFTDTPDEAAEQIREAAR